MGYNIDELLTKCVNGRVSDIHIRVGMSPHVRIDGSIFRLNMPAISEIEMNEIIYKIIPENLKNTYCSLNEIDFAYNLKNVCRFRVNLSLQLNLYALSFRVISKEIPPISNLNLPKILERFVLYNSGLILITGPTGSGKTTTLASLINLINNSMQKHIITIEDPIEFVHESKKCLISQRQVNVDTKSFEQGIKYALRQDPDVILVGEIRDKETLDVALMAAETGHLVFSTLHTIDASHTINRILGFYEPSEHPNVRAQLASVLKATVAQRLLPKKHEKGRIPACEVLHVTSTVSDYIIKDKLEEIYNLVRSGSFGDMISMNNSLKYLIENDIITTEEALMATNNRQELSLMLKGVSHGASL